MRVLIPLDGSEASFAALDRGLALLKGTPRLEVTLFNVMQEGFDQTADPEYVEETFEKDEADEVFPSEASQQRVLARGLDVAKRHGVAVKAKGEIGKPVEEILREAAHHDVLLMHALGASSVKDTLKGSHSEHLVRHAPCSVLLVPGA